VLGGGDEDQFFFSFKGAPGTTPKGKRSPTKVSTWSVMACIATLMDPGAGYSVD